MSDEYKSRLLKYGIKSPNRHTLNYNKFDAFVDDVSVEKNKTRRDRRSPSRT